MPSAFFFYLSCSLRNRVRFRLMRLREPKYFISLLAGLAYVYFFFLRHFVAGNSARIPTHPGVSHNLDLLRLMETGFSLVLLWLVLLPWLFPYKGGGIAFSEAEAQFLFPAPVSRRALLHFRIARGQLGILFSVVLTFVMFARGAAGPRPPYLIAGLWIVYSFLALYRMGTALSQTSLAEHGVSGLKRQVWVLALLAIVSATVFAWLRWFLPSPPPLRELAPAAIFDWIYRIAETGPAHYFLLPFRTLVRPALAQDFNSFLLRLPPALSMLGMSYFWVIRGDTSFEEASLERAEKAARRLEALRKGSRVSSFPVTAKARRIPFRLSARGYPFVAIFWKNLISASRFGARPFIPAFVALALFSCVSYLSLKDSSRHTLALIIGATALGVCGFVTFMGPVVQRDDLRTDLLHIGVLKTFPLRGWMIVLGEILGPTAVLTSIQWVLILISAYLLPDVSVHFSLRYSRLVFGLGAAILFPGFTLLGVLIQNAAVLLLPGWMRLGKEQQHGIEAMGQRMITMSATFILLALAVVPGAMLFAAAFFAGFWLIGQAVIPFAALVAVAGLCVEAAFVIAWLGRLFERFDASLELRES